MVNTLYALRWTAFIGILMLSAFFTVMPADVAADSVSGTNASEITVTLEIRKGGKWIKIKEFETDQDGVIESENIPPGKYRLTIDADDRRTSQTVAFESRLVDDEYRPLNDETTVRTWLYLPDNTKVLVSERDTDDEGWLETDALYHGMIFEIDVRGNGQLSQKNGKPRIKIFAKIDGSRWFHAATTRYKDGIVELEHVLPGKYKIKAKRKDVQDPVLQQPFTIQATLYDDDGDRVNDKTKVKLYGYFFGVKVKLAELSTDDKGHLSIPETLIDMTIRLDY